MNDSFTLPPRTRGDGGATAEGARMEATCTPSRGCAHDFEFSLSPSANMSLSFSAQRLAAYARAAAHARAGSPPGAHAHDDSGTTLVHSGVAVHTTPAARCLTVSTVPAARVTTACTSPKSDRRLGADGTDAASARMLAALHHAEEGADDMDKLFMGVSPLMPSPADVSSLSAWALLDAGFAHATAGSGHELSSSAVAAQPAGIPQFMGGDAVAPQPTVGSHAPQPAAHLDRAVATNNVLPMVVCADFECIMQPPLLPAHSAAGVGLEFALTDDMAHALDMCAQTDGTAPQRTTNTEVTALELGGLTARLSDASFMHAHTRPLVVPPAPPMALGSVSCDSADAAVQNVREPSRKAYVRRPDVHFATSSASQLLRVSLGQTLHELAGVGPFVPLGKPLVRWDGLVIMGTENQATHAAAAPTVHRNALVLAVVAPSRHHEPGLVMPPECIIVLPLPSYITEVMRRGGDTSSLSRGSAHAATFVRDIDWCAADGSVAAIAVGSFLYLIMLPPAGSPLTPDALRAVSFIPVLDTDTAGRVQQLHADDVRCLVAQRPDFSLLASGSNDGLLAIRNLLRPDEPPFTLQFASALAALVWHPTHAHGMLASTDDGGLHLIDLHTRSVVRQWPLPIPAPFALAWPADNIILVGHGTGTLTLVGGHAAAAHPRSVHDPLVAEIGQVDVITSSGKQFVIVSGAGGWSVWSPRALDSETPALVLLAAHALSPPPGAPLFPAVSVPGVEVPTLSPVAGDNMSALEYTLTARVSHAVWYVRDAAGCECALLMFTDTYGMVQIVCVDDLAHAAARPPACNMHMLCARPAPLGQEGNLTHLVDALL